MKEPMTQASVEEAMISIMGVNTIKEVRLFCKDTEFWQACKCLEGWEKVEGWTVSVVLRLGWKEEDWLLQVSDPIEIREYKAKEL